MFNSIAPRRCSGQDCLCISSRRENGAEKTGTDRPEVEIKDEVLPALDHRQKSLRDPLRPDPDKPTPRSGASWFDRDGFLDYNRNDSDAVNLLKGVAAAVVAVPLLVGAIVGVVYLAMQVPVAGLAMVCIAGYAISHAGGIG